MELDLVIRNGTIVDGTGQQRFAGDVGVIDGRIAVVGRVDDRGTKELDATGQVVTPGFIDGHTHMDAQFFWDPLGTCSCWHGVTTVVMGNCGFTLAPAGATQRPLVVRNLERAEDISGDAMEAGIEWTWDTFRSYLDVVDRLPKAINVAANIGHSALRTWAMGERAFEGPATESDLLAMESELRDALAAGAIGLTTSRSPHHETSDNRPVASRMADWAEVTRLVSVMGGLGVGIFELAGEGPGETWDERLAALQELAVNTGVPVTFGLLEGGIGPSQRPPWSDVLRLFEETARSGGRMFGQTHSRELCILMSFRTRLPFDRLPGWRELRSLPLDEQRRLLEQPEVRARLVREAHEGDYQPTVGAQLRRPDYDLLRVLRSPRPGNPTVAAVAREMGLDPVDAMIQLALDSDFDQMFQEPRLNTDLDAVLAMLLHPQTVMTFSDSGAHVSQIMDSSIHTNLLAYWVRERNALTLEAAVRMITSSVASAWGFVDRGRIGEGMVADLNILDPETIEPELPTVVSDLPGGGKRLIQKTAGIQATIVRGEIVIERGEHTGALPGRLLRGPLSSAEPA